MAQELADEFGITVMAVRKHLQRWQDEGLVDHHDERQGRGRPRRYFTLTKAGHARFPDNHADLTIELIGAVRALFGEEGLSRLIDVRERQQQAVYRKCLAGAVSPADRLSALAAQRSVEGYMARAERCDDGTFVLIEDHCPICAAARDCQGFCRSELAIFKKLFAGVASVERVEHVLDGGRRCVYRVTPQRD